MPILIAVKNGLCNRGIYEEIREILSDRGIYAPFTFRKIGENFRGDVEFLKVVLEPVGRRKIAVKKFGPCEFGVAWIKTSDNPAK